MLKHVQQSKKLTLGNIYIELIHCTSSFIVNILFIIFRIFLNVETFASYSIYLYKSSTIVRNMYDVCMKT